MIARPLRADLILVYSSAPHSSVRGARARMRMQISRFASRRSVVSRYSGARRRETRRNTRRCLPNVLHYDGATRESHNEEWRTRESRRGERARLNFYRNRHRTVCLTIPSSSARVVPSKTQPGTLFPPPSLAPPPFSVFAPAYLPRLSRGPLYLYRRWSKGGLPWPLERYMFIPRVPRHLLPTHERKRERARARAHH